MQSHERAPPSEAQSAIRNPQSAFPWRMSADWWFRQGHYFMYVMRELSSVFAALWLVLFLAQVPQMAAGPHNLVAYNAWREFVRSPGWVLFSLLTLVFVLYHAWTWFSLMGVVMRVRLGKTVVSGGAITSVMLMAWAGASLVLAFIVVTPAIGG